MYFGSNVSSANLTTNNILIQRLKPPCGSTSLEKQNRSIDLSTGALVAILNIVEIIMIAKIQLKKKIYEIILMSLSVSDCLFGFSNVIVSSIFLTQSCKYRTLLEITYVTYVLFILTSIFHLVFIGVDRALIVLIPFKYETIFTTKRLKIGISLLWILALTIGVSSYIVFELKTYGNSATRLDPLISQNNTIASRKKVRPIRGRRFQQSAQLVLSIIIVILDLLMILCYLTIIYHVSYKNSKGMRIKRAEDQRLPVLCVVIASVFVTFTLPFAATRLYLGYVPFWANYCLILNSGMNSIVYFFRKKIEIWQKRVFKGSQNSSECFLNGSDTQRKFFMQQKRYQNQSYRP